VGPPAKPTVITPSTTPTTTAPSNGAASLPYTASATKFVPVQSPTVVATSTRPTPAATPTELPFTGLAVGPLLFAGLALVLIGLSLMVGRRARAE
jgi:hypothetical protein